MSKKVLITAGPVYAALDSNKIVSNRCRGIWAKEFATYLIGRGFDVYLLLPLTMRKKDDLPTTRYHDGYWEYARLCAEAAPHCDAMVLASAVVNWIPKEPFPGKMPTDTEEMSIPFILAPRVIDEMKRINPRLTLIGCKLTVGQSDEAVIDAAWHVAMRAKCAAVIANDLNDLHRKWAVHSDGTAIPFLPGSVSERMKMMYKYLEGIILDEHFRTVFDLWIPDETHVPNHALFDRVVDKYREHFASKEGHAFGSLMIQGKRHSLCSPREKDGTFTSDDAAIVTGMSRPDLTVTTINGKKATLNAPLLISHGLRFPGVSGVLHLHEQLPDVPTLPYYPPGTAQDSFRPTAPIAFNIEGHGFVAGIDGEGNILK